jgi:hypothetical protein
MLSERLRRFVIVSGLVAMLGVSVGTAVAKDDGLRTDPVSGTFEANPVNVKLRTCTGEDGQYLEIRGEFAGPITSPDPRLTGELKFTAAPALVNTITGFGTFQGPFQITDEATGKQKSDGQFYAVVTDANTELAKNHGFAVGKVVKQGDRPSADFFASFKADLVTVGDDQTPFLHVEGQFGAMDDNRTPAVVQGGHCGPFTPLP